MKKLLALALTGAMALTLRMMCGRMSCSFCNKEMVRLFIPEKQHYICTV